MVRAGRKLPARQRNAARHERPRPADRQPARQRQPVDRRRTASRKSRARKRCKSCCEGFLPQVGLDDKPQARQSGFQEFGLPYAADAAITRYLAAFLTAHRHVTVGDEELPADHDPARPDIVLFNGGFFASPSCAIGCWKYWRPGFPRPREPDWQPLDPAERSPGFGRRAGGRLLRHGPARRGRSHRGGLGADVLHRRGGHRTTRPSA